MKEPRVKDILENYKKGNLNQVYIYLTQPEMQVDPSTWSGQILRLLEDKKYNTVKELIEITFYKFNK